jgi:hypothetical protein
VWAVGQKFFMQNDRDFMEVIHQYVLYVFTPYSLKAASGSK